jgi:hypothetical protein
VRDEPFEGLDGSGILCQSVGVCFVPSVQIAGVLRNNRETFVDGSNSDNTMSQSRLCDAGLEQDMLPKPGSKVACQLGSCTFDEVRESSMLPSIVKMIEGETKKNGLGISLGRRRSGGAG